MLAKVANPLDRDLLARRAADLLGIREELLRRQAGGAKASGTRVSASSDGVLHGSPQSAREGSLGEDRAESALVALMLRFPSVVDSLRQQPMDKLVTDKWRDVIRRILENGDVEVGVLTDGLSGELSAEISALVLKGQEIDEQERDRMTADCLFFLQRRYLKRLEQELRRAIRIAEETSDDEAKKERMRQWQEVVQRERRLERMRPSL